MALESILEEDYEKLMAIEGRLEEEFTDSERKFIMTQLLFKIFNKDEKQAIKYLENVKKKLG